VLFPKECGENKQDDSKNWFLVLDWIFVVDGG
jgi:hypothetical protein